MTAPSSRHAFEHDRLPPRRDTFASIARRALSSFTAFSRLRYYNGSSYRFVSANFGIRFLVVIECDITAFLIVLILTHIHRATHWSREMITPLGRRFQAKSPPPHLPRPRRVSFPRRIFKSSHIRPKLSLHWLQETHESIGGHAHQYMASFHDAVRGSISRRGYSKLSSLKSRFGKLATVYTGIGRYRRAHT